MNKQYNLSKLDICSLSFIIMIVINPLAIFSLSFKLTFIVTFFIIIGSYLNNSKSKVVSSIKMAILAFTVTIPLVCKMNYQINFITILISPIYLLVFSKVIMPVTYLITIIPMLTFISEEVFILFQRSISFVDSIDYLKVTVGEFSPILTILYFVFLIIIYINIERKKLKIYQILIFLSTLVIVSLKPSFDNTDKVIMFDVSQGDSMLIKLANNKGNIVIDSYGNNIKKIKTLGIKRIDAVIITHSDNDHIETASSLFSDFKCQTLISSKYDNGNEMLKLRQLAQINKMVESKDNFGIGKLRFNIISPIKESDNINNNSIVFNLKINNTKILFTGDMEKEEEKELIDAYKNIKTDILKVPHHGSNTSLSDYFYENISFDVAIISVGLNNKFKHPNIETLEKLKNKKIYRTDLLGDIYINIYKGNYKIKTNINKSLIVNLKTKYINLLRI